MRHLKVAPVVVALLASCAPSEDKRRHDIMDAIEAGLRMPRRAASFEEYARYYARTPDGSIIGLITVPLNAGDPKAWDNLEAGQRRWVPITGVSNPYLMVGVPSCWSGTIRTRENGQARFVRANRQIEASDSMCDR